MVCAEKRARLRVVPITDDGEVRLDEFERLLSDRTKIVAVVHVSNALGTILDAAFLRIEDGRIEDASFNGPGCAISKASASLMTENVKGKTLIEADELFQRFERMITHCADEAVEDLGTLSVFAGVRQFPVRVKCASLAWHTRWSAIGYGSGVSTE
jgi:nitrogen fixation protein NifU and related proteins